MSSKKTAFLIALSFRNFEQIQGVLGAFRKWKKGVKTERKVTNWCQNRPENYDLVSMLAGELKLGS